MIWTMVWDMSMEPMFWQVNAKLFRESQGKFWGTSKKVTGQSTNKRGNSPR
jgi:hypothetical protein